MEELDDSVDIAELKLHRCSRLHHLERNHLELGIIGPARRFTSLCCRMGALLISMYLVAVYFFRQCCKDVSKD